MVLLLMFRVAPLWIVRLPIVALLAFSVVVDPLQIVTKLFATGTAAPVAPPHPAALQLVVRLQLPLPPLTA